MSANLASIVAVMGASGSGKSSFIKQGLRKKKPTRLLIWDPMEEYGEFGDVIDSHQAALEKVSGKKFSVVFRPGMDQKRMAPKFDFICKLAFAAGDMTFIVEELKLVTRPAFAPMPWVRVSIQGRHKGLRVIGTSQRPAHIDKDFLGNATLIHTGLLNYDEDIRAVASAMRMKPDDIAELKPLEYLEKNKSTGDVRRGKISF